MDNSRNNSSNSMRTKSKEKVEKVKVLPTNATGIRAMRR